MNADFTERLIQEVRSRPVLYLSSHPDFKSASRKLEAWREIKRELDEEITILKTKWKNLRDTYRKHQQGRLSTGSHGARKLQRWTWAEHMAFVDPPADADGSPGVGVGDVSPHLAVASDSPAPPPRDDDTGTGRGALAPDSNSESIAPTRRTRRRHRKNAAKEAVAARADGAGAGAGGDRVDVRCDGVDLLFLGYAHSFKRLSRRKQIHAKFAIAKALMEAELGDLDDATYECYEDEGDADGGTEPYAMSNGDEVDVKEFDICP